MSGGISGRPQGEVIVVVVVAVVVVVVVGFFSVPGGRFGRAGGRPQLSFFFCPGGVAVAAPGAAPGVAPGSRRGRAGVAPRQ